MKIIYIGTYPPRECGIGTFTHNKFSAIKNQHGDDGMVVAISDHENVYDYPPEVGFVIKQDRLDDYLEAARFINDSGADVCILEHEYGIFGGQNGVYILPLLHRLKIPFIAVLHTVLKTPSYNEKAIAAEIAKMAARTVVMTHKAVKFLTEIYKVPAQQIEVIHHGVPDMQFSEEMCKKEFSLENNKVLLTFGLLGPNKGIETVLKALPPVVAKYPQIVYIILGKTHPSVLRHSGDEYRNYLKQLSKELQLEKHVLFLNEFVHEELLFKYLSAADIYVTPYLSEAQITSGTLSYAIGAGCAVVSTPYWHAAELLADGRGRLFDFSDTEQLSAIFMGLLDNPEELQELKRKARKYGGDNTWPKIGEKYIALARAILQEQLWLPAKEETIPGLHSLPPFTLEHAGRLTDSTGIIQHATFGIPNLKEGYCLDDNARAMLMVLMANKYNKHPLATELLPVYLSYIHYLQNDDGTFKNFMSFNRNFLDTVGSEDSFGRAIWALGYLLSNSPNDAYYQTGRIIFFKAMPNFDKLTWLRSIANVIIGISHYLQKHSTDVGMTELLRKLAYKLVQEYDLNATEHWKWFERKLTYDNALLPLSLLHAGGILKDEKIMETAMESMNFLSAITLDNGYLSVIGNEEWYEQDGPRSSFAQQPIDAMGMVLMFQQAYLLTEDDIYLEKMHTSFRWFLGENDLRMSLYDSETKGCCDGLEKDGVNRNQGAESTLAYLIAHLALRQALEDVLVVSGNGMHVNNVRFVNSDIARAAAV